MPEVAAGHHAPMVRICPKPPVWASLYRQLQDHAANHACVPAAPPVPLILGGWIHSNDVQKQARWAETAEWAAANGAVRYVEALRDADFYEVEHPSAVDIGPAGGPMYLPWSFERKSRLQAEAVAACLAQLSGAWAEAAGQDLAACTAPVRFTGRKARRLLVEVTQDAVAPWGDWQRLPADLQRRRAFTRLRAAINTVVSPHHVDHIDFEPADIDSPYREWPTSAEWKGQR